MEPKPSLPQSLPLSHVKRRRGGKKSAITRKINEIASLISERGSRTKIRYLREILQKNLKEAIVLHEELMLLLDENDPEFNDEWINNLALSVDTCIADTERYFLDRIDDPDSINSQSELMRTVDTWRKKNQTSTTTSSTIASETHHGTEFANPGTKDVATHPTNFPEEEVTNAFSRLYLNTAEVEGLSQEYHPDVARAKSTKKLSLSVGDITRLNKPKNN